MILEGKLTSLVHSFFKEDSSTWFLAPTFDKIQDRINHAHHQMITMVTFHIGLSSGLFFCYMTSLVPNIFVKITSINQSFNLVLQLVAILGIMDMILVKMKILLSIPFCWRNSHQFRLMYIILVLYFHYYLGMGSYQKSVIIESLR